LENLDAEVDTSINSALETIPEVDINSAWETIRGNILISAKERLGY
jgi:hypothetical protein